MKYLTKFVFIALLALFTFSCERNKCVDDTRLAINITDFPSMHTLYENDSIIVQVPEFCTPNNDGVFDLYFLRAINIRAHTDAIISGHFEIRNNCEQLFYTENINEFEWDVDNSIHSGRYINVVYLHLIDNNIVDTSFVFELHR